MTFIPDNSFLLEMTKYARPARTQSDLTLMGRVLPDP